MKEIEMFETLIDAPAQNPTISWSMQFQHLKVGLDVSDGAKHTLHIGPEEIRLTDGIDDDSQFSFVADQNAWTNYANEIPPVGYQALTSMVEKDHMDITGDTLEFARHGLMLEKLFSCLRPQKKSTAPPLDAPYFEQAGGRYLHLNLWGQHQRIYVEEAGPSDGGGQPIVCLHTAGSDGRQYRGLMADADVLKNHRVIAFDLPGHGKSSPLAGFEASRYMLTTQMYVEAVMAVCQAMQLKDPIVMGCSIGGRAVLHLSLKHGDYFKAAIGLQSATHAESHANEKLKMLDKHVLSRPDMHGGEVSANSVQQIMSPLSPSKDYWETLYYYMQSGPGVFAGDLYYYFVDGDMRNGLAEQIDTEQCPLYLLTGEYDLSATPEMTEELAKLVKAQHCQIMKGLGHFPMSENYAVFRDYLNPVLDKIAAA
jgi:pimeloyl-ACP methyl ester carboxylesterase